MRNINKYRESFELLASKDRQRILSGFRGKNLLNYFKCLNENLDDRDNIDIGYLLTRIYLHKLFEQSNVFSWDSELPKDGTGYQPLYYDAMIGIIDMLKLSKDDIFYDLGSGRGLFTNLIGLTSPCTVKGIEYSPSRALDAERITKKFDLQNVINYNEDVLDCDFSDGTVFFMFNPFYSQTVEEVMNRIKQIKHKVRIVTYFMPDPTEYGFKEIPSSDSKIYYCEN